jgi:GNAT superfamily N-acetyltransferase
MDTSVCATVRRFAGGDWEILKDLRLGALADSPAAFLGRPGEEAARAPEAWWRAADQGVWFGAFVDGLPAGLASVVYDVPTGDRYAESMWVRPRFRGRGVAVRLLEAAEGFVTDQGGSVLRLWVLEGNPWAAAVYVRYGFRPTGLRQPVPGYPGVIEQEFIISVPSRREGGAHVTIRGTTTPAGLGGAESLTERSNSIRIP